MVQVTRSQFISQGN